MYCIAVTFTCFDQKREAFVARVRQEGIYDAIRKEDGCICYDYYFAEQDPNQLLLVERWESKAHQQAHIATPHMDALRAFKDEYVASTLLKEFEER
ncbi:MAG: antibiotic biosynthesis monooxygenase [Clostridia bacterium]|nr:antibiotic biosynthesis monooxygenase [Clostridia bacterium]